MENQYRFALKEIFLTSIHFCLNPAFTSKDGDIAINTAINVNYEHKAMDLTVTVKIEVAEGSDVPFSFAVEGIGRFVFTEEPPPEILDKIARVNCAAMVFPYVREAIADLTRRAGISPLHLQPVNFVNLSAVQGVTEGKQAAPKRRGRKG